MKKGKLAFIIVLVCILGLLLSGCGISQEKYDDLESDLRLLVSIAKAERDYYHAAWSLAEVKLESAELAIESLEYQLERARAALAKRQ